MNYKLLPELSIFKNLGAKGWNYLPAVLFAAVFNSASFAQHPNTPFDKSLFENDKEAFKEADKELQKGESFYNTGIYSKALTHFLKANEFNPDFADLNMKIGQCYLYSSQKPKALKYLEHTLELNPTINSDIHLLLAKAYHLDMQWDKAIEQYGKFVSLATKEDKDRIDLARKRIEECNFGKTLVKQAVDVKIDKLGVPVNTEYAEYHPLISADESVMYFTSRRDNTTGGKRDPNFDVFYEDIYFSKNAGGKWAEPQNLVSNINTDEHDATVGLSPDGQQLFIYKDDAGDGNIYFCKLDGDHWSQPEKLNVNINSQYNETTACFSYDGLTIYFVSDRPGGFGENDIYTSKKKETGDWGTAQNLGASINTNYNEDAVFMHPDGKTLYFSSEGHKTMGGYDIFKSVYDPNAGIWSTPENLGYPINSTDDDVFFVLAANGKRGYYSSIKSDGLGEKDIYMITFPDNNIKSELTLLKGIIIDKTTNQAIEANIEVVDNDKNEVILNAKSNKLTGEYLLSLPSGKNYGITVTADGYFFHSENIDIPESSPYFEILKKIAMAEISEGKSMILNFIYFDFDKATLRDQSIIELERVASFMGVNLELKIEIGGHTDNKGTEDYNQILSEQRAKAVVDWLVAHQVDKNKLAYKGYWFSKPIADNNTEEGRAKNRRTEFVVLKYNKQSGKEKGGEALAPSIKNKPKEAPVQVQSTNSIQNVKNLPAAIASASKEITAGALDHFSSNKYDYYVNHQIPVDPQMPDVVIYRIQIGSFSKLPDSKKLNGLYPVICNKLPNNVYRCSAGEFRKYEEAKAAQQKVRDAGFPDAFLIAFYKGEKISVSQAANLD